MFHRSLFMMREYFQQLALPSPINLTVTNQLHHHDLLSRWIKRYEASESSEVRVYTGCISD